MLHTTNFSPFGWIPYSSLPQKDFCGFLIWHSLSASTDTPQCSRETILNTNLRVPCSCKCKPQLFFIRNMTKSEKCNIQREKTCYQVINFCITLQSNNLTCTGNPSSPARLWLVIFSEQNFNMSLNLQTFPVLTSSPKGSRRSWVSLLGKTDA